VIGDHRSAYFAAGVNAIVGKPVNWDELSEEMEHQLATKASTRKSVKAVSRSAQKTSGAGPVLGDLNNLLILDEAALGTLADALGEDVLAPMLETFKVNMAKYCGDLNVAADADDFKQAKRTAHALKGLCAQFGAVRASRLAKFIETEAEGLDDVRPILPLVAEAIAAADKALAARRAKIAGAA
jgi:HPt (histidine-containing phosphotransfer) domain-containing protein